MSSRLSDRSFRHFPPLRPTCPCLPSGVWNLSARGYIRLASTTWLKSVGELGTFQFPSTLCAWPRLSRCHRVQDGSSLMWCGGTEEQGRCRLSVSSSDTSQVATSTNC